MIYTCIHIHVEMSICRLFSTHANFSVLCKATSPLLQRLALACLLAVALYTYTLLRIFSSYLRASRQRIGTRLHLQVTYDEKVNKRCAIKSARFHECDVFAHCVWRLLLHDAQIQVSTSTHGLTGTTSRLLTDRAAQSPSLMFASPGPCRDSG